MAAPHKASPHTCHTSVQRLLELDTEGAAQGGDSLDGHNDGSFVGLELHGQAAIVKQDLSRGAPGDRAHVQDGILLRLQDLQQHDAELTTGVQAHS
eukprot:CAMPEP_0204195608 /NCGR_PEP_ID=MMETSP0361-20130328/63230_1 /ASSEMBLY_ACC=CAM_ASM_000343 /TAXON_ID=268821 /ORGANISM="Scrippsiella Hangoei, Strain SHTV-5" /LENGTH=95 /DNA_ID=CAMNT_0051157213 /DNA_START=418 /DNA_END=706 /DNA_ORIENTATION=+